MSLNEYKLVTGSDCHKIVYDENNYSYYLALPIQFNSTVFTSSLEVKETGTFFIKEYW